MFSRVARPQTARPGSLASSWGSWCAVALLAASAGCQTAAPIHVWSPPEIVSAVGKKVAIAPLAGPRSVAQQVENQLFASIPRDDGRRIEAIPTHALRPEQAVRLASASQQSSLGVLSSDPVPSDRIPSDLALLPLARQQGIDYLLMGEVLPDRSLSLGRSSRAGSFRPGRSELGKETKGHDEDAGGANPYQDRVSIAWRVYDVAEARPLADRAMVTEARSPDQTASGPADAALQAANPAAQASGRAVWRLLVPTVQPDRVELAVPWLLPGSQTVRRGNELARQGRWPEAERVWQQAADRHPYQHAAKSNLAIAAAARQDFSTAKRLIREAIQQRSKGLYEATLVWIESRQRDYHEAFGLADPPEGWFVTAPSSPAP